MERRPKIKVSLGILFFLLEIIAISNVLLTWYWVLSYYSALPDVVPSNFNFAGKAVGYGSKDVILAIPTISTVICLFMVLLARKPHLHNYSIKITEENASRQYLNSAYLLATINTLITTFFTYMTWHTIHLSLGKIESVPRLAIILFLILIFLTPILYLIRSQMIR